MVPVSNSKSKVTTKRTKSLEILNSTSYREWYRGGCCCRALWHWHTEWHVAVKVSCSRQVIKCVQCNGFSLANLSDKAAIKDVLLAPSSTPQHDPTHCIMFYIATIVPLPDSGLPKSEMTTTRTRAAETWHLLGWWKSCR